MYNLDHKCFSNFNVSIFFIFANIPVMKDIHIRIFSFLVVFPTHFLNITKYLICKVLKYIRVIKNKFMYFMFIEIFSDYNILLVCFNLIELFYH